MNKTILASAIIFSLSASSAQADIAITNFFSDKDYSAGGTLTDAGSGNLFSIDPFFYHTWTASQETYFMDNTGSWSGSSLQGAYNYDNEIAAMTSSQIAVGLYFNWSGINETAMLEIFDCTLGVCTGVGVPLDNGPHFGQVRILSGTGNGTVIPNVPIPTPIWLFSSGLLALIKMGVRKKT